jgi:hypothetical protein
MVNCNRITHAKRNIIMSAFEYGKHVLGAVNARPELKDAKLWQKIARN